MIIPHLRSVSSLLRSPRSPWLALLFAVPLAGLLSCCSGGSGGGGGGGEPQQFPETDVAYVAVTPSLADDVALKKPLALILDTLKEYGLGEPEVLAEFPAEPADRTLVVGESGDPLIQALYSEAGIPFPALETDAIRLDAFVLSGDRRIAVATGGGPRGVVYAMHALLREIHQGFSDGMWAGLSLQSSPAFKVRYTSAFAPLGLAPEETDLMNPDEVLRMGYNGIVLYGLTNLCTYDSYDPDLYDPDFYGPYAQGIDLRRIVEEDREAIMAKYEDAKAHHLEVFLDGDMLLVPSTAFIKWPKAITHDNDPYLLCPGKAKVFEIIEATIDEIFQRFPDLDGIQIRTGEVYTFLPTVSGNHPATGSCPSCENMTVSDKLRAVVNVIRSAVVDKYGKRFNKRAWGYYNTWHSEPEKYLDVVDTVPPDDRLTFSFKQQRTDYWRYNALNPNFGQGPHGQWVEFQCQREYEGKGAFPLYMGRYFAEGGPECGPMGLETGGMKEIYDRGVRGGWGWARGGGWDGPYIKREEWVALNSYALGRLFWDPELDPYDVALEWLSVWADKNLPEEGKPLFVKILKDSEQALLKARYVRAYAAGGYVGEGNGWTPCLNWMRDDVLTDKAAKIGQKLYQTGELDDAIAEKEEVLSLADEMMGLWDDLRGLSKPSDTFWQELYNTALYGDSLLRTIAHYYLAVFYYTRWNHEPSAELRQAALQHLDQWSQYWEYHKSTFPVLPGTATPFKDDGMEGLCETMRNALGG